MDPIFKKCLVAITHINEQLLPEMGHSYNKFADDAKTTIINNQCLNESRKFSKAAIEAINSGLVDNTNIRRNLEYLREIDYKLDDRSRYLTDLISDIKSRFTARSKEIASKNLYYLNEMKTGNTPAQELLIMIATLGKDIQKVVREEIPNYQKELQAYIKKAENLICDSAYKAYNEIIKLDSGTLPAMRVREWTYLPDALFRTSGAFVHDDFKV